MAEQPEVIQPPKDEIERDEWRREIAAWRTAKRAELQYDGAPYRKPEFEWTSSCMSCGKIMVWDEAFLDHRTGTYHVEAYLDEARRVFGGYDSVVLWHAYPRIGFDDRNQFDFYRDLPGGLAGLAEVVRRFHAHNVRVFIDYNPWDTGTRREPEDDEHALARLVGSIGADGIFLDTLSEGGVKLRTACDQARPGVAFESELALPVEAIPINHLSWAQWFDIGTPPGVLRNRWFEQRHMMHLIRRWDLDHTDELHLAWMNGAGVLVWENIFGSWNGWRASNRHLLKTMLPIQRAFRTHFQDGIWTPLVRVGTAGLYASEWRLGDSTLWTIVNRTDKAVSGPWVDPAPGSGRQLYDLIEGSPMTKAEGKIEPFGIAAVLAVPNGQTLPGFESGKRADLHSSESSGRLPHVHPIQAYRPHSGPTRGSSSGLRIEADEYTVVTHFRTRECGERGYAKFEA